MVALVAGFDAYVVWRTTAWQTLFVGAAVGLLAVIYLVVNHPLGLDLAVAAGQGTRDRRSLCRGNSRCALTMDSGAHSVVRHCRPRFRRSLCPELHQHCRLGAGDGSRPGKGIDRNPASWDCSRDGKNLRDFCLGHTRLGFRVSVCGNDLCLCGLKRRAAHVAQRVAACQERAIYKSPTAVGKPPLLGHGPAHGFRRSGSAHTDHPIARPGAVSFDALAPWYRALETMAFGNALQRARVAWLGEISSPRRALIVGEGNGRFLSELLRIHPAVEVDCVDSSERMLALARQNLGPGIANHSIHFLQADIRSWTPPEVAYDLIVTHFLLDCFPEDQVANVVARLSGSATTNANWLLADFRQPSGNLGRLHARAWLFAMYQFFRFTARIEARELVDPSPFIPRYGFVLQGQRLFRGGMLKSEIWRRTV